MKFSTLLACVVVTCLAGCATQEISESDADIAERAGAPLFEGMGSFHRPISTSSAAAQRYFDQGMVLAFGFNHAEAIRSFRAAQKLDPDCAMCFWGEALATGPNINVTSKGKAVMSDAERLAARAAIDAAIARRAQANPMERELIDALSTRYNGDPPTPRDPLDNAWAEAMRDYVARHPDDHDAAAIYAEAWMNTMPWDYWSDDGEPKAATVEVINTLERILERSPDHPLALHLYIHAVEASSNPGRAEAAADRLAHLVPGSGHLVHMPAHIYWRVGRYHDAAEANVRAAAVDERYIAQCNAQGFYPALYYPHNIHFLWAASSMQGRSSVAIPAARKVAANVRLEQIQQFPTVEFFKTIPVLALVQFGRWDEVLAEPALPAELEFSAAIMHYARGTAYAAKGELAKAKAEHAALEPLRDSVKVRFLDTADYPASVLLAIADQLLAGDIALAEGEIDAAVAAYEGAVATQDSLPYMEPPFWYYPTRQSLGKALMAAERFADAEAVYEADLDEYPLNGWSMFGLIQALKAQGKSAEAGKHQTMFDEIWAMADVELTSSRL